LPLEQQARLLRLMASKAIIFEDGEPAFIRMWLQQSHRLNPSDRLGMLLSIFYSISPYFCKLFLQAKTKNEGDPLKVQPFFDLEQANSQ
jgi:hypothetical protein